MMVRTLDTTLPTESESDFELRREEKGLLLSSRYSRNHELRLPGVGFPPSLACLVSSRPPVTG